MEKYAFFKCPFLNEYFNKMYSRKMAIKGVLKTCDTILQNVLGKPLFTDFKRRGAGIV